MLRRTLVLSELHEANQLVPVLYDGCTMAAIAGIEGPRLSQQALLDLERSKVSPVELLEQAARILEVDYPHLQSTLSIPEQGNKPRLCVAHCAPKEQWILRWLLKKTGLCNTGGKIKVSSEDSVRYDAY